MQTDHSMLLWMFFRLMEILGSTALLASVESGLTFTLARSSEEDTII